MKATSQGFRAATVATMVHSATVVLATSATGGVLRRLVLAMPGAASWPTKMATSPGSMTIRNPAVLFVA